MKVCRKCGELKEFNEFYLNKLRKDGRVSNCKFCIKIIDSEKRMLVSENKLIENKLKGNKICVSCSKEKNIFEFKKRRDKKDGYESKCKECYKNRKYSLVKHKICNKCNIDKNVNEFHKDYKSVDNHRNSCKDCVKNSGIYNRKIISECNRVNKHNEFEKLMELSVKTCYMCNIEKSFLEFYKSKGIKTGCRNECKECSKKYSVNYIINDYKLNPINKLKHNIRSNIIQSFKKRGFRKHEKTHKILKCSINDFIKYIESKFEPWMTWENHGKYNGEYNFGWDLDHIKPISLALTIDDVVELNTYTNFQPLCSKINRFEKKDNY